MLETLEENIRTVLALGDDNSLESINERMEELQKELLKTANAHKDYSDLADEIDRLREQKQNLMTKSAEREGLKQRVAEMKEFLNEQIGKIEEYDESLVRRILEKVTIYDSYFTMEFKSGVSVDIRR